MTLPVVKLSGSWPKSPFCVARHSTLLPIQLLEFRGDTVINSSAGGIHTKNVMFLTAPDTQVVFSAPTVILERDEVGCSERGCCSTWGPRVP